MGRGDFFWLTNSLILPIDMAAVYFTAYWLVPQLLLRKKYKQFIAAFLISAVAFVLLERILYYYVIFPLDYPKGLERPLMYFPSLLHLFIGTYTFVFLFSGVRLFRSWINDQQAQIELQKQNLTSELALLRSQVNPHFLFNTLNNIDSLVFTDQEKASDSIVRLSEIMRYMLYESNANLVPLEKEIHYLESMIKLLRLRLRQDDFIQFQIEGNPNGKLIPPMLLGPFVENAYKHGQKVGPAPGILIQLAISKEDYVFEVTNHYENNERSSRDRTGGIGLANVQRRLELIYQNDYTFTIDNQPPVFRVRLQLPAHLREESLKLVEKPTPAPITPVIKPQTVPNFS